MNKYYYIISVAIYLMTCSCNSQKTMNKTEIMMTQYIDANFENFDFSILKKSDEWYENSNHFSYLSKDTLSNDGTQLTITGDFSKGVILAHPQKGWFKFYKEFYPNGNIRLKRIFNKTSNGDYGKMYEFNEQGKLVKTTDFDEGWLTSFEEVTHIATKYAKKYNYKVETAIDGEINDDQLWKNEYVKIWRKEHEGKKYWLIGFNKAHFENSDDRKTERLVILIDDSTRQIVDKNHYFDWYNRYFKEPFEEK